MCLLFFSLNQGTGYSLVLAANRDEFLARPTAPLGYLDESRSILGGRDLQGGGTWLAVAADGRYGALTNFRQGGQPLATGRSRGEIILNYLESGLTPDLFAKKIMACGDRYAGFNLIIGSGAIAWYCSNKIAAPVRLDTGFYGLSNHLLDTPWPKVSRGKQLLEPRMQGGGKVDEETILACLQDRHQPADEKLPATGVTPDWERLLAPIFISAPGYGTRSSAVLTISQENDISFLERSYLPSGGADGELFREEKLVLSRVSMV